MSYERISIDEGIEILQKPGAVLLDIRDPDSYNEGHVENAVHIDNSNITNFINSTDKSTSLVIYCYHGNMSQGMANHFIEEGFTSVFSVDGGYEQWRHEL